MQYESLFIDHQKHSCLPPDCQRAIWAVACAIRGESVLPKPKAMAISLVLLKAAFLKLSPETISRAAPEIRAISGLQSMGWRIFDPSETAYPHRVKVQVQVLDDTPDLAMLYLFHGDGRLRQEALLRITPEMMSPFLFAAVALRLNDWVRSVRHAATACMGRIDTSQALTLIAPAIPVLCLQTKSWSRWGDSRAVYDDIEAKPEIAAFMASHFRTERKGKLAKQFLSMLRYPSLDIHLSMLTQEAATPAIRTMAYVTLLNRQAVWPIGKKRKWVVDQMVCETICARRSINIKINISELARNGAQDRSVNVRREIAYWLLALDRPEPEVACILAQDKYPSIRRIISFYQRKQAENA